MRRAFALFFALCFVGAFALHFMPDAHTKPIVTFVALPQPVAAPAATHPDASAIETFTPAEVAASKPAEPETAQPSQAALDDLWENYLPTEPSKEKPVEVASNHGVDDAPVIPAPKSAFNPEEFQWEKPKVYGKPYQSGGEWRQDYENGTSARLETVNGQQVWVTGQFCLPGASEWSDEPPQYAAPVSSGSACANGQCSRRGRGR